MPWRLPNSHHRATTGLAWIHTYFYHLNWSLHRCGDVSPRAATAKRRCDDATSIIFGPFAVHANPHPCRIIHTCIIFVAPGMSKRPFFTHLLSSLFRHFPPLFWPQSTYSPTYIWAEPIIYPTWKCPFNSPLLLPLFLSILYYSNRYTQTTQLGDKSQHGHYRFFRFFRSPPNSTVTFAHPYFTKHNISPTRLSKDSCIFISKIKFICKENTGYPHLFMSTFQIEVLKNFIVQVYFPLPFLYRVVSTYIQMPIFNYRPEFFSWSKFAFD